MVNWKTTLFGLLAALGAAITGGAGTNGATPTGVLSKVAIVLQVAGTAGLALSAKDKNVTGGDTGNKSGQPVNDHK